MADPTEEEGLPSYNDVREQLTIDPVRLEEDFVRTPADLGYWNTQCAMWASRYKKAENDRKKTYAEVRVEVEDAVREAGGKATVDRLDALVLVDHRYVAAQEREMEALERKEFAFGIVDSLRHKADMLVSLGAHVRQEKELSLRDRDRGGRG